MSKKLWIVFAIIIALLIANEFIMPVWGKDTYTVRNAVSYGQEQYVRHISNKKVQKQLNDQNQRYQQKNAELLNDFMTRLPLIADEQFQTAENNVDAFVKKSTKFTFCTKLMYRMLKDKCTKKDSVSQMLDPLIREHFAQPMAAAQTAIQNELQNFMLQVQENDNQYRAGLMELTQSEVFQKSDFSADEVLVQQLEKLNSDITKYAMVKVATAVSAGFEVVFIRATITALRSVGVHIAARMGTTLGIAGASALVDGPLPIGDAIGAVVIVVGSVWTICDIYKAWRKLPNELRTSLHKMIADYRTQLQNEASQQAKQLIDKCNANIIQIN